MADFHLIRFRGGKLDGQTLMPSTELFGWPLPERLCVLAHPIATDNVAVWAEGDPAGLPADISESPNVELYEKVKESQLPDDAHENLARGAEYKLVLVP